MKPTAVVSTMQSCPVQLAPAPKLGTNALATATRYSRTAAKRMLPRAESIGPVVARPRMRTSWCSLCNWSWGRCGCDEATGGATGSTDHRGNVHLRLPPQHHTPSVGNGGGWQLLQRGCHPFRWELRGKWYSGFSFRKCVKARRCFECER